MRYDAKMVYEIHINTISTVLFNSIDSSAFRVESHFVSQKEEGLVCFLRVSKKRKKETKELSE